jgi:hypothetical protein
VNVVLISFSSLEKLSTSKAVGIVIESPTDVLSKLRTLKLVQLNFSSSGYLNNQKGLINFRN